MSRVWAMVVIGLTVMAIPPLIVLGQTPAISPAPTFVFSGQVARNVSAASLIDVPLPPEIPSTLDRAEQQLDKAYDLFEQIAQDDKILTRHPDSTL